MNKRSTGLIAALCALALATQGCSSRDRQAADAASTAEAALAQGQNTVALQYIHRALALHDDVADYWLLLAHINIAMDDSSGAYDAYQSLLSFDRGNLEALGAVCQLATMSGDPKRAQQFGEQLALLQPDNPLPATLKAAITMQHGANDAAKTQIDAILQKDPNFVPALLLKSRLLSNDEHYDEAAKSMEDSLKMPGNPYSRLVALKDLYLKANNRDGYESTIVRLANNKPDDAQRQLDYADLLYEKGQNDAAYAVVRRTAALQPDDLGAAAKILDIWLRHDNPLPADRLAQAASGGSLEIKATYAQYANEIGRPDLALSILGPGVAQGAPNQANSDAKAAYAYALGLRGDQATAMSQLNALLAVDPLQPRALVARARLGANPRAAVEDARQVVSDDATNVIARLTLADALLRQNDAVLAETTLREGMTANGSDTRVLARLVLLLRAQGRQDSAAAAIVEFSRANPFSLRVTKLPGSPS